MDARRVRLRAAARAALSNLRNPQLRRAQGAFGAAWAAEWAFTVGISVVAFRDGGAAAVGLVALLRMVPSALLAPVIAAYADRYRRERVLVASSLVRAAATGAIAIVLTLDAPVWTAYALAVVSTIAVTPYRAAHSALLPSLCATAEELTASNVVRGLLDSLSVLIGPLLAAALLEWASPDAVFVAVAAAATWSALLLVNLDYESPPRPRAAGRPSLVGEVAAGVRVVARDGDLAAIFALTAVQTFTRGCLTVLTVVVAIDVLDAGDPGVGVLTGAMGVGAVLGSVAATLLIGNRALGRFFVASVALWGAPLCLIGLAPSRPVALLALALVGIANAVLDVGLFTIIARLAVDEVLARVFGVLEGAIAVSVGLGAILAPVLIDAAGVREALVIVGALGPAAAAVGWLRLRRLDADMGSRDTEVDLLREVSLLRPLPMPAIEQLARCAELVEFGAGETVCRQGEVGDRFYVIVTGDADVLDGDDRVAELGRGEGFGEIALLRDVPRSRTVRARTALAVYAIRRSDFTPAVRGYSTATEAATALMDRRLAAAGHQAGPLPDLDCDGGTPMETP